MQPLDVATLAPPLNYKLITNDEGLKELADYFQRVSSTTRAVGLDVETNVADTFAERYLRTIQIGDRNEQYIIDLYGFAGSEEALKEQGWRTAPKWAEPIVKVLEPVLNGDTIVKVGHNLQFEYEAIEWCLGIGTWHLWDLLLGEKILYAGSVRFTDKDFWGLDDLTRRYLKLSIDKTLQTSFNLTDTSITPDQCVYGALDVRLPMAIFPAQRKLLEKHGLLKTAQIEFDAVPAFGEMRLNGVKVDRDRWFQVEQLTIAQHLKHIAKLDEMFIPFTGSVDEMLDRARAVEASIDGLHVSWQEEKDKVVRAQKLKKKRDAVRFVKETREFAKSCQGEAWINYGSPSQVLEILRKAGYGPKKLPTSSDDHLAQLEGEPIIDALRDYRTTFTALNRYGVHWVDDALDTRTQRVHSNINQLGADTGRTSSSSPNIQNVPTSKTMPWLPEGQDLRWCFVATDLDWDMVTIDYNGCELRILAELSQEPAFVNAFNNGWDVHSFGAEIVYGDEWKKAAAPGCAYYEKDHQKCTCKEHKLLRDYVKAINFGIAYGMEADKLARSLKITKEAATKLLAKYRASFATLIAYLKKSGDVARLTLASRTIGGRRRMYKAPDWEAAKKSALEKAKKFGRDRVDDNAIARSFHAQGSAIEREGKNAPIQGTNADMLKLAIGCGFDPSGNPYLWHYLRKFGHGMVKILNVVHDELVSEARKAISADYMKIAQDCMERAGKEFIKSVPVESEGSISFEWKK